MVPECVNEVLPGFAFGYAWLAPFFRGVIGTPLLSFQIISSVVIIPTLFVFSDLLFSNHNNWSRLEGLVAKSNNLAVWLSIAIMSLTIISAFFMASHFDAFHADARHYRTYYAIAATLMFLLFSSAYKK